MARQGSRWFGHIYRTNRKKGKKYVWHKYLNDGGIRALTGTRTRPMRQLGTIPKRRKIRKAKSRKLFKLTQLRKFKRKRRRRI